MIIFLILILNALYTNMLFIKSPFFVGKMNCAENITCCNGNSVFTVETFLGTPGSTGATGLSSVKLDLCDKLQFYSEGASILLATPGSARVRIEPNNIMHGSGNPTNPPLATDVSCIYHNTDTNSLHIWNPNSEWSHVSQIGTTGTLDFQQTFLDAFNVDSFSVSKEGNIGTVSITSTNIGASIVLNQTMTIGTVSEGFRPRSNISGLFPYGGGISDIGSTLLTDNGILTFRTGNNAYLPGGTSFTLSLLYII